MTFKSMLGLALFSGRVADAVHLSASEQEQIHNYLAQLDTESLTINPPEGLFTQNLAQIGAYQLENVTHACSTAHDRNKLDLPDFYSQQGLFTDTVFVKEDALFWQDYDSENSGQVS